MLWIDSVKICEMKFSDNEEFWTSKWFLKSSCRLRQAKHDFASIFACSFFEACWKPQTVFLLAIQRFNEYCILPYMGVIDSG